MTIQSVAIACRHACRHACRLHVDFTVKPSDSRGSHTNPGPYKVFRIEPVIEVFVLGNNHLPAAVITWKNIHRWILFWEWPIRSLICDHSWKADRSWIFICVEINVVIIIFFAILDFFNHFVLIGVFFWSYASCVQYCIFQEKLFPGPMIYCPSAIHCLVDYSRHIQHHIEHHQLWKLLHNLVHSLLLLYYWCFGYRQQFQLLLVQMSTLLMELCIGYWGFQWYFVLKIRILYALWLPRFNFKKAWFEQHLKPLLP